MSTSSGVAGGGKSGGKICAACGEDVSNKPRTKDKHGRYFCTPCYEQAIAAKRAKREDLSLPKVIPQVPSSSETAAPPRKPSRSAPEATGRSVPHSVAADPDSASILEGLIDLEPAAAAAGKKCPGCGSAMSGDAIICLTCGYNMQTGQRMEAPSVAVKASSLLSAGSAANLLGNPMVVALCALAGFGLFGALAWGDVNLTLAYVVINALFALGVGITVLIFAFREGIGQGFATLCIPCYSLYFVYGVCDNLWLRWLFAVSILSQVVGYGLQIEVAEDLESMGLSR